MKLISAFWLVCRKVLLGVRDSEFFFFKVGKRKGLWKYISQNLPAARSSNPVIAGWKSTFCDNVQISPVHCFLKYTLSSIFFIFVFLPRFQNVRAKFDWFLHDRYFRCCWGRKKDWMYALKIKVQKKHLKLKTETWLCTKG